MAKNFSNFQRGSGCYTCSVCGRKTRATGVQSSSSDCCPQCYDIAGQDNLINDTGGKEGRDEASMRYVNGLLGEIGKRGGDVQKVRDANPYVWPKTGA